MSRRGSEVFNVPNLLSGYRLVMAPVIAAFPTSLTFQLHCLLLRQ